MKPKVYCIGDVNTDIFLYTNEKPELGIEKKVSSIEMTIGGNAGNTAMALGGLGVEVVLVSAAGDDAFTPFINSELKRAEVKKDFKTYKENNGKSVIFVASNGKRGIMSSKGALTRLDKKTIEQKVIKKLQKGDAVHFGGYYHLPKLRSGFKELLKKIKKKGAHIFFDTTYDEYNKWELKEFVQYIDTLFLNELELEKVSGKKNIEEGVKWLLKNKAKKIVVKLAEKGSYLHDGLTGTAIEPLEIKARNSTGAGDFFNGGFIYSKMKGYGDKAALLAAHYTAGKKISTPNYTLCSSKEVDNYLGKQKLMDVIVAENYADLSMLIAGQIKKQVEKKPGSVFCLASGKTPEGAYSLLEKWKRKGEIDFGKATFLEMDEYLNVGGGKLLQKQLREKLLNKMNFKKMIFFNQNESESQNKKRLNKFLSMHELDFVLLGLGENGHIAFNEPGTKFNSEIHITKLTSSTKKANKVDAKAITLGIKNILDANKIILAASGERKREAVKKLIRGKQTESLPASALKNHKNVKIILDKKSASLL